MPTQLSLYLHEEVLLLALRDDKGTIATGAMLEYTLAGSLLAELLLEERIRIDTTTKRKLVEVVSPTPLGRPLLDESLERLISAKRRAGIQTWVSRLAGIKKLKHRAVRRLCELNILQQAEDKVLWVFPRIIYPEVDHTPEAQLIERLRQTIFSQTQDLDPRTVVLVSLAQGASLLPNVFEKSDLKLYKHRLQAIAKGDLVGQATKEVMEGVQAAIMVACIMPAVMASVTS
ncbi:GPP34 family phosphoprotein [Planctomycetota bacterium]